MPLPRLLQLKLRQLQLKSWLLPQLKFWVIQLLLLCSQWLAVSQLNKELGELTTTNVNKSSLEIHFQVSTLLN
jgi:hypothetical protein